MLRDGPTLELEAWQELEIERDKIMIGGALICCQLKYGRASKINTKKRMFKGKFNILCKIFADYTNY